MTRERHAAMAPLVRVDTGPQPIKPRRRLRPSWAFLGAFVVLSGVGGGIAGGLLVAWWVR